MQSRYIDKLKMSLSPLGFGVMRLSMNPNGTFPAEVHKLLAAAYEQGINYFDTGYIYLSGHSEELIRDVLVKNYSRSSFYIADKLPVWECKNRDDMERIFNIQLERLGVEYIDFYLLHGLNRFRWTDMQNASVLEFLESKKREGRINKVGFSIHDDKQTLEAVLNSYDWDFAQLQINYYDWTAQRAKDSYDILAQRDIPCMVMEPVGGGRLAKLPTDAEKLLKNQRPDDSIASWAIRFAASLPNVIVTLSGMSNMEQLTDNLSVFNTPVSLSETEKIALNRVVEILSSYKTIPCTACGYCVKECPRCVDIPQIFTRYNDYVQFENATRFDVDYHAFVPHHRRASNCVSCGLCIEKCPQNIDIPKELDIVHRKAIGLSVGVDIESLMGQLKDNTILVCFGAGAVGRAALSALRTCGIKTDYFCDNSEHLWETTVDGVKVISPMQLQELNSKQKIFVLITSGYRKEIKEQLGSLGIDILIT
jgi:hypothetical protein